LCHLRIRKEISIRDLHERTGALVREAATGHYAVIFTDRGRPVATMTPCVETQPRRRFSERVILPGFAKTERLRVAGDSTLGISEDRDRD